MSAAVADRVGVGNLQLLLSPRGAGAPRSSPSVVICAVPEGTRCSSPRYPALPRWANLSRAATRDSGACLYGKPVKITRGRVEPYYFVSIIINLYYLHLVGVTRMATKAKLVREMRLDKRLTQADVAAKMKISQASYSAIELGEKPRAVQEAVETINRMRTRTDRTDGGSEKTGRLK